MILGNGEPQSLSRPVMGRVTFKPKNFFSRKQTVFVLSHDTAFSSFSRHVAVISSSSEHIHIKNNRIPLCQSVPKDVIERLHEDDIIYIDPSGSINRLWEAQSEHNTLMVSYSCNCHCLMCPQPIEKDPSDLLEFNLEILKLANKNKVKNIGLTGGEPTLRMDDLCEILHYCKKNFPTASLSLLTNGRIFGDKSAVKKIASTGSRNLCIQVSLHADIASLHDLVSGNSGCFIETIRGLHNLALFRQLIEIRVVILKQNYRRLPQIAEFIYRNFPFAVHIAFMGLEITHKAQVNIDSIWVEPNDFVPFLTDAVQHLNRRDLDVSIYNLPYCILPPELWHFTHDSISGWKKMFPKQCNICSKKEICPGLFSTSIKKKYTLNPIL